MSAIPSAVFDLWQLKCENQNMYQIGTLVYFDLSPSTIDHAVVERIRRWTTNWKSSTRVGSNPGNNEFFFFYFID